MLSWLKKWRSKRKEKTQALALVQQHWDAIDLWAKAFNTSVNQRKRALAEETKLWLEQGGESCLSFGRADAHLSDLHSEIIAQIDYVEQRLLNFKPFLGRMGSRDLLKMRQTLNVVITALET